MNLDFPNIQQVSKYHLRSTVMALARNIFSLKNLQGNMPFAGGDDSTSTLPTYLSVPILVARNLTTSSTTSIANVNVNVNDEQKPQVVGYAFLGPCRKSTMGDTLETRGAKNMAIEVGKWVNTAYLRLDVPEDAGDGDYSSDNDSGYDGEDGEGSEVGSVDSEGSVSSEGGAASYAIYGSEGSQESQTSVSSAGSDHNSDDDENEDEDEDSEDEENDRDDDGDPYGEVEDDDFEFD